MFYGRKMSERGLLLRNRGIDSTACSRYIFSAGFAVTPPSVDSG